MRVLPEKRPEVHGVPIFQEFHLEFAKTVSAGMENIFDTLYEIKQYFPMSGRSFNISLERSIEKIYIYK